IAARAIRAEDGSAAWIALNYLEKIDRYQFDKIGPNLFDGLAGLALFLAALEKLTGKADFTAVTNGALKELERMGLRSKASTAGGKMSGCIELSLGAATGLGSLVYALT